MQKISFPFVTFASPDRLDIHGSKEPNYNKIKKLADTMKKVIVTIVGLMFCVGVVTSNAAAKLTAEQKADKKALLEKYDANKDGKIDKDEKAKMSAEDKDKWAKLQGGGKKQQTK